MEKQDLNSELEVALNAIIGEEFKYSNELLENICVPDARVEAAERDIPRSMTIYAIADDQEIESSEYELDLYPLEEQDGHGGVYLIGVKLLSYTKLGE